MANILVVCSSGGTLHAQTVACLFKNIANLRSLGHNVELMLPVGGYKQHQMNNACRQMIKGGYDYMMSVDADMIFPDDRSMELLLNNDKDIVMANYRVRSSSITGEIKEWTIKMKNEKGERISTAELPSDLFRVSGGGLGFVLIKGRVFHEIEAPWFEEIEDKDGNAKTEDVVFFDKCYEKGIEMWCNPKINMGHIGTQALWNW